MSPALAKMWIALTSMAFMSISVFSIYLSRYKVKNKALKAALTLIAFVLMVAAGLIVLFVVFSGPTPE
jgi:hypothetical protein